MFERDTEATLSQVVFAPALTTTQTCCGAIPFANFCWRGLGCLQNQHPFGGYLFYRGQVPWQPHFFSRGKNRQQKCISSWSQQAQWTFKFLASPFGDWEGETFPARSVALLGGGRAASEEMGHGEMERWGNAGDPDGSCFFFF